MVSPKKFYRETEGKVIAGVCAGLATYFNMDVDIVRVLAILFILFTGTTALIAYIIVALVVPERPVQIQYQNMEIDAKPKS